MKFREFLLTLILSLIQCVKRTSLLRDLLYAKDSSSHHPIMLDYTVY